MSMRVVVGNFLDDDLAFAFADNNAFSDEFPADYAHDGPGKMAARYPEDAAAGDPIVDFSLNLVKAAAINWTAVTGTVADSADQDHGSDSTSLKVLGNAAQINSLEYEVRSGYSYWLEGWGFGSGAGPEARISLYNPKTKHWWNGTAWVASVAYLLTGATAAAWVGIAAGAGIRVDVEAASVTLGPTTTLQVQLWRIDNTTGAAVYFDDIFLYAGLDFVGFFGGHNVPPWVTVEWHVLTSAGSDTLLATFTKAKNQFFLARDAIVFAYEHILKFDIDAGTISPPIYFGDVVIGKMLTLSKTPMEPMQVDHLWKGQSRLETAAGASYIANRSTAPVRRITLNFRFANAEDEAAALDVWIDQARGGEVPVVVMPSEKFPALAIYGNIGGEASLLVLLQSATQSGNALGDLAGSDTTQDHYSDLTVVVDEGAVFTLAS